MPLQDVAAQFGALAASIRQCKPDAAVIALLDALHGLCEQTAARVTGEARTLLSNLTTALRTWQDVWPRLGTQPEFRGAVVREAELWSKRLAAMAKETARTTRADS